MQSVVKTVSPLTICCMISRGVYRHAWQQGGQFIIDKYSAPLLHYRQRKLFGDQKDHKLTAQFDPAVNCSNAISVPHD